MKLSKAINRIIEKTSKTAVKYAPCYTAPTNIEVIYEWLRTFTTLPDIEDDLTEKELEREEEWAMTKLHKHNIPCMTYLVAQDVKAGIKNGTIEDIETTLNSTQGKINKLATDMWRHEGCYIGIHEGEYRWI